MNPEKSPHPLRRRLPAWMASIALLLIVTAPLHAHHLPPGMEDIDEFEHSAALMAGLRHPTLGFDHWMVALAIGWVAAASLRSRRVGLIAGAAFAAGGLMGTQGIVLLGCGYSFAIAVLALGAALAMQKRIPLLATLGLVGIAALLPGNAHGIAWPIGSAAVSYVVGVMATSLALASVGFAAQRLAQSRLATPALA